MKTLSKFLFFTLCILFSNELFSQNFISEDKVWNILANGGMDEPWTITTSFKFSGDTTIQQKTYYKLLRSKDEQKLNWTLNSLWFERNDSVFQYILTIRIN